MSPRRFLVQGLILLAACQAGPPVAPPHSITVTVTDSVTQRSLVQVAVSLQSDTGRFAAHGVTDSSGHYRFTNVPPGPYQLTVDAAGYPNKESGLGAWRMIEMPLSGSLADVAVRLQPFARIRGRVLNQDGTPQAGLAVEALPCSEELAPHPCAHQAGNLPTPTGERGGYLIDLLPGRYLLVAYAPLPDSTTASAAMIRTLYPSATRIADAEQFTLAAGNFRDSVDIIMVDQPSVPVSGQMRTASGNVATGRVSLFFDDSASQVSSLRVRSAEVKNGAFTLPAVPAGQYILEASIGAPAREEPGMLTHFGRQRIVVGNQHLTNVVLTLGALPVLQGRVDAGLPTASEPSVLGRVSLHPVTLDYVPSVEDPNLIPQGEIGADGRFVVSGIRPGQYLLRAELANGTTMASAMAGGVDISVVPIEIAPEKAIPQVIVRFGSSRTEVSGVVVGAAGLRVANACVAFFPSDSTRWDRWQTRLAVTQASREGRYIYAGLLPGDYAVVATPVGVGGAEGRCPPLAASRLRALLPSAQRIVIQAGGKVTIDLQVVVPR